MSQPRAARPRELWWLTVPIAAGILLLACRGAPLGEAVADDFDFLHDALFERFSFFDGGGSQVFWRPLAQQVYFRSIGRLALSHPSVLAGIHLVLLMAAALVLYRAARRFVPAPAAAAVATFPLLAEPTRNLLGWASHSADLGLFLFTSLALHEATRRRLVTTLAALGAALLCKEFAVLAALSVPWVAAHEARSRRVPLVWGIAVAALLAVWALAYGMVCTRAGLAPTLGIPSGIRGAPASAASNLFHAGVLGLRSSFSLGAVAGRWDRWAAVAGLLVAAAAVGIAARDRGARARLRERRAVIAWGAAWFVLTTAVLASGLPIWQPYRTVWTAPGLAVAIMIPLWSIRPWLAVAVVLLRTSLLLLAPALPDAVSPQPEATGAWLDFGRLVRLQRLMIDTRTALETRYPTLPPRSRVGQHFFPQASVYALSGDKAVQVWYRDPTLRWTRFDDVMRGASASLVTIAEYQPSGRPQVALVRPEAMEMRLAAMDSLKAGAWASALLAFERADQLQDDTSARLFFGSTAYGRAYCDAALGRYADAEAEARRALATGQVERNARFVLALTFASEGRTVDALTQLDSLLARTPGDADALDLRRRITASRP